jgi:hypothetical protein
MRGRSQAERRNRIAAFLLRQSVPGNYGVPTVDHRARFFFSRDIQTMSSGGPVDRRRTLDRANAALSPLQGIFNRHCSMAGFVIFCNPSTEHNFRLAAGKRLWLL